MVVMVVVVMMVIVMVVVASIVAWISLLLQIPIFKKRDLWTQELIT